MPKILVESSRMGTEAWSIARLARWNLAHGRTRSAQGVAMQAQGVATPAQGVAIGRRVWPWGAGCGHGAHAAQSEGQERKHPPCKELSARCEECDGLMGAGDVGLRAEVIEPGPHMATPRSRKVWPRGAVAIGRPTSADVGRPTSA